MRTLAAALVALSCANTLAAPIPILNAGFEADFTQDGSFPVEPVTDWPPYDPNNLLSQGGNFTGVLNPTGTACFDFMDAPEGRNWVLLFLTGSIGQGPVGVRQDLGIPAQPYTRYTLTVEVGNIASCAGLPPFDQFFELGGFPGYAVQIVAGGAVLEQDNNTLFGQIPEGEWRTTSVVHTTGANPPAGNLEIRLINLNEEDTPADPGIEVDFDDVRLDATAVACSPADITADGACTPGAFDQLVTLSDFSCYLSLWSADDPQADITTDGLCAPDSGGDGVSLSDFSCYLAEWSSGCP